MNKEKLTLNALLARKERNNQDKMSVSYHYSPMLDATIEIVKKKARDIISLMAEVDPKDTEGSMRANLKLIYTHCDIFRNEELKEAYGVIDPYDVIYEVFEQNLGEINNLADSIMKLYGLAEDKKKEAVEELKN